MVHIALITGRPSQRSRGGEIARVLRRELRGVNAGVAAIEMDGLPHSALLTGCADPHVQRSFETVAAADAVVVVTPRYEPSGSAPLRAWLGDLPRSAVEDKAVLPVGFGALRSQATGLGRMLAHEAGTVLPGCFLYDRWFRRRLDRWRLQPNGVALLADAVAELRAMASGAPQAVAS
ncbi:NAD(P)H-dependent oxidoreductase [Saccharopolyspora sp. K220]|uniref:NAD(P)H-dependent oxidoreductase n=1 Tax=Saccharopolyspora soli TaxID=2926618 RepID=UPI001F59CE65|nr:NAD(P)H-dependent oxidoreductase [Saccharopolyspora soli]MCI2419766.1 NAD(P)H-dependent oxidoreductase [Saccharopolyspora soli]